MELKWRPNAVINRFWNSYKSNWEWIIVANTQEELEIFTAYGFKPITEDKKEEKIIDSDYKTLYLEKYGKEVPSNKKNDIEWIKSKL